MRSNPRRHLGTTSLQEPGPRWRQVAAGGPRLFDLLRQHSTSARLAVPLGLDLAGRPVWVDLREDRSQHLFILDQDRASLFETLRGVAIGAALSTRPSQLQVVGIDPTGRELTVLETLPHAATETAVGPAEVRATLLWLLADLEARSGEGRAWPDMLIVIADVDALAGGDSGRSRGALMRLVRSGGPLGIHIVIGAAQLSGGLRSTGWSRAGVARLAASRERGGYTLSIGSRSSRLTAARLTAADLNSVAEGHRHR